MCRLVQRAILADDEEALERLMPYIKCLNAFILDEKGLLARKTVTHRTSRMTKAQADSIQVGSTVRSNGPIQTKTPYTTSRTLSRPSEATRVWQSGIEIRGSCLRRYHLKNREVSPRASGGTLTPTNSIGCSNTCHRHKT